MDCSNDICSICFPFLWKMNISTVCSLLLWLHCTLNLFSLIWTFLPCSISVYNQRVRSGDILHKKNACMRKTNCLFSEGVQPIHFCLCHASGSQNTEDISLLKWAEKPIWKWTHCIGSYQKRVLENRYHTLKGLLRTRERIPEVTSWWPLWKIISMLHSFSRYLFEISGREIFLFS